MFSANNIKHIFLPIFVLLLPVIFLPEITIPQENNSIRFNRFTTENMVIEKGLSQNTVRTIIQDNRGFLWFGTWDGLNKFDTYEFKILNTENGLSNSGIHCLYEDKKGMIWIGTENGLNKLDRNSRKIIQFFHEQGNQNSLTNNKIYSITEDKHGCLWIGTGKGLSKYDPETGSFTSYFHTPEDNTSLRSNRITKIFFDRDGFLWIGTYYGLIKFDINTLMTTRYYNRPEDTTSLSDNLIRTIFQDRDGDLWIGTENGLNKFDYWNDNFISYKNSINDDSSLSNNKVYAIHQDREGIFWVGTYGGGINLFNKKTMSFTRFIYSSDNLNSLSNNNVYCIYEDRSGNIWIGTYRGVNKVDRSGLKFKMFTHMPREKNCLSSNIVWSFFEDTTGVLWIATGNGINLYDKSTGTFSFLQKEKYLQNSISSNKTRIIFKDSEGIFWIGTEDKGIDRLDTKNWKFTNYQHDEMNKNSLCDNDIWYIYEDSDKFLWFCTVNGLSRFDRNNKSFKNYKNDPFDSTTISGNTVYSMFENTDGKLFFCTKNGLCSIMEDDEKFYTYTFEKDGKSVQDLRIVSINKDKEGIFWIGTMGDGLLKFDPETQTSRFYTEKNGLPNNVVYAALVDNTGNLWMSTNWGLSKLNKETESVVNFDIEDGLQSYEFNAGAAYKSYTGEMYFGGMNGFNSFFPEEIKSNNTISSVVITDFKIYNKETNNEYFDGDTIHLNYKDNFFTFEFSSLDYVNPLKNKYRYILENVDKDWVETDATHRYAEYKNTPPGTYIFKLKGSNNGNSWSDNAIELIIIIKPPWWKTVLFKILFSFILIFSIFIIINRRFISLKKKHEKEKNVLAIKQQLTDLERKSLRLQMNPHFIFNSLNSIQSFVVTNESDKAIHYLAKFSKLMRMILQNSREQYIALSEEIAALNYYIDLEKLRFGDKFDYEIFIDPNIDSEFIGIPPMIIQPYVENSIIHGLINKKEKGIISIRFEMNETYLKCTIKDNGIGREEALKIKNESGLKRESQGMRITKERLDILNKEQNEQYSVKITDLKSSGGLAEGTIVELKIFYEEL